MSKKSWGGAGAWAADAELAESEEASMPAPLPTIVDASAFPSLGEAASAKVSKKKKPQPVPIAKFMASKAPSLSDSKGLTYEDMVMLPTGPRDRSGEEIAPGGLGGGFRDYGGFRGSGGDRDSGRRSDRDGGRDGGFGRESGFGRDSGDEPSRADNVDDWGATKKFVPSGMGTGRYDDDAGGRRRMGDFSSSKADEDSHWGSSKKFTPAVPASTGDRRPSKYDFSARNGIDTSKSVVDEVENWASAKRSSVAPSYDSFSNRDKDFGLPRDRDGADGDKWIRNRDRDGSRPLSASKERPRLVLQPRTQQPSDTSALPVAKEESAPLEHQPTSEETVVVEKPARKINPFGEAKPREVVLQEKGLNWRHLDTDVDPKSVDRTSEELSLKEEIKRIEDAIKEKEAECGGKENDDEDEEAKKVIAELKAELIQSQEKLESLTLSSEKKENGRATDAWSRNSSNGRPSVIPPPERRGGRW